MDILVPQEARALLALVQSTAPAAVIGGGYLRDLAAGVAPKDVDIFVPAPFGPIFLTDVLRTNCRTNYRAGEGYGGGMRREVMWVGEVPTDYLPLNIIVTLPAEFGKTYAETIIGQFDFDFCRVVFDGHSLHTGEGFARAISTRTATYVLPTAADVRRSRRRAERWAEKFAGWTFVFPEVAA